MITTTTIKDNDKEIFTRYGKEEGCAGCRTKIGSLSCETCIEEKIYKGRIYVDFINFQPATDYHRRPQ